MVAGLSWLVDWLGGLAGWGGALSICCGMPKKRERERERSYTEI